MNPYWLSSQTNLNPVEPWAPAAFSRKPQKEEFSTISVGPLGSLEYGLETSIAYGSKNQPGDGVNGEVGRRCTEANLQWGNSSLGLWSESQWFQSFCGGTIYLLKSTFHPQEGKAIRISLTRPYRHSYLQDPPHHKSFFIGGPASGQPRLKHPRCKHHSMVPSESRWDYKTIHHILINISK